MIVIRKGNMEFKFPKGEFTASQDTPTGMYFRFRDGTELIINAEKTPQLKTIPTMLQRSEAEHVLLDFNNPKALLSFPAEL